MKLKKIQIKWNQTGERNVIYQKTWSKCTFHDESFNLKSWTIRDVHHHFCSTWHQCSKPVQKYNGKNIYSLKSSKTCYNSDVIVQELYKLLELIRIQKQPWVYHQCTKNICFIYQQKHS